MAKPPDPNAPYKPVTGVEQMPRGFKEPSQNPKRDVVYTASKSTLQDASKLAKVVGAVKAAKSGFDKMVSDIKESKDW